MKKLKQPLLFSLAILPFAAVGAIFTCLYQFDLYPPEMLEQAIAQIGSEKALFAISVIQTLIYAFVCSFLGHILANKTGLWKPVRFQFRAVGRTLLISAVCGILFGLDYWTFGKVLPQIADSYAVGLTPSSILAAIFYGGIIEEVMLRLFLMTLIVFLFWKLFFRKQETVSTGVIVAANVIAAMLFAAGHLPATVMTFGALTPLILIRCFLFNGGFGLVFGYLYRKHGIQYAMLSHAIVHIVSKLIWLVFI